ncbi:acetyl-CoA transmembrane transporter [Aureococcus anophagefferens]|nr:acetyl-CoA transmembrane transporter [Aureococcus anophagefferens]
MRLVPRTVVAAARLRGVQALVAVVAALVAAACLAPSAALRWGLGAALGAALAAVLGAVYLQPTFATDLVERHERCALARARPVAALTIDDVPNYGASRLEEILSILREHGARATLFVMSACLEDAPDALKAALAAAVGEGLVELGNHGAYDEPAVALADADFVAKHDHCDAAIRRLQEATTWFRPGSGLVDRRVLAWAEARGYRVVLGNCYPHDPLDATRFVNASYLRRRVRPGCVVILHDRWHTPATLRAYFANAPAIRLTTLTEAFALADRGAGRDWADGRAATRARRTRPGDARPGLDIEEEGAGWRRVRSPPRRSAAAGRYAAADA